MNAAVEYINAIGGSFVRFTWPMLIQASVLIVILLLADLLLRKHLRAVFRYWLWMLVLIKLMLPVSLSTPASLGTIAGDKLNLPVVSPRVFNPENQYYSTAAQPAPTETQPRTVISEDSHYTLSTASMLTAAASTPAQILTWQAMIFLTWLAVVTAMLLLLIQRVMFVYGLIRQSQKANPLLTDALECCRKKIDLKQQVSLRVSPNATSPAVCGLFRPVILVPNNLAPSLGSSHLKAVLMHELAHIKRGDLWINMAQTLLQIIYFYNPLLWLANAVIRRVREQAVDEAVQVALAEKATQYPETLLNVAKLAFERPALSLRLVGVVESKNALKGRINKMLEMPIPKTAKLGIIGLIVIVIAAVVLLPMAEAEKSNRDIENSEFKATLANSVAVELVGVSEYPSEGKQWWSPQGKILDKAPYATTGNNEPHVKRGYKNYEFALRLQPFDASYKWISGGYFGSDTGSPRNQQGRPIIYLKSYQTGFPTEQEEANIRIGVTAAEWKTVATIRPNDKEETIDVGKYAIAFGAPYGKDSVTNLPVVHNYNRGEHIFAVRVIAVDKSGQVFKPGYSGSGGNKLNSLTYHYHELPLDQVEEFQFQTRPYQWVTFKNVSLEPGYKTNVQIETEQSAEGLEKRAKELVEDFFKHNYRDITARKTIEWGQPTTDENRNLSIRYKYEATIWGKDKIIEDKVWTFDPKGNFLWVRKAGAEDIYSPAGAQALVENFFANNYRDVTARETIEWGEPEKDENGSVSIRYKYEATIWGKDKKIMNQIFTFDKNGKYISTENLPGFSQKMDKTGVDAAIDEFSIQPYPAGGLFTARVSIANKGTKTIPEFRLRFYKGDPADNIGLMGKPQSGSNGAGPIEPGKTWSEGSMPFPIEDGEHNISVVLDYENEVEEIDETNNSASVMVKINRGKIVRTPARERKSRSSRERGRRKLSPSHDDDEGAGKKRVSQNPIGKWKSVDFVRHIEDFEPGEKQFRDELYLERLNFYKDGATSGPWTWKMGSLYHPGDRTTAKYEIREINGDKYLFMEWMSGDVTIRGQKPAYYVLKKLGLQRRNDISKSKRTELSNDDDESSGFYYSDGRQKLFQIAFSQGDYKIVRKVPLSELESDKSRIPKRVRDKIESHNINFNQLIEDCKSADNPMELLILEDPEDDSQMELILL